MKKFTWSVVGFLFVMSACRPGAPVHSGPAPSPVVQAGSPSNPSADDSVPGTFDCAEIGATVPDDVKRVCVPLRGDFRGSPRALVSLVVFSDFECPFCSRVLPTLETLLRESPDVRIYFHHAPLPFHKNAMLAARAAVAAGMHGKFWPMHDKLFANQQALDVDSLGTYAGEVGLEVTTFKADLAGPAAKAVVDADLGLGRKLGVRGTPQFFINGRQVTGAQPYDVFKAIVDDELARAQKLLGAGTPHGRIYAAFMAGQGKGEGTAVAEPDDDQGPRPTVSPEVFKVEVGDSPARGGKAPKVTLVAFSDFQCPFCARANETLDELRASYQDNLQIVFKQFPLPFHARAQEAALAALAAGAQGKFWPMHDKLFAGQASLEEGDLRRYAAEVGLDVARFSRDVGDPAFRARMERDLVQGRRFAVQGTPSFFVNGRAFSGAYPLAAFKAIVDGELAKADRLIAAGTPRADLYATLIKDGLDRRESPKPPANPDEPDADVAYRVGIEGAPVRGAKDALVTIAMYSDFQCPFCQRAEPTLDRVLKDYDGKVRVAWRNLPLPFHDQAMPAALAAMAAGKQGKFWEMHRRLFADSSPFSDETLRAHARALKLDMKRWQKDRADPSLKAGLLVEGAAAAKLGVRGTPMFFINGRILRGSQPYQAFKTLIDVELARAEALVKQGVPAAKVYETLMKTAQPGNGGKD